MTFPPGPSSSGLLQTLAWVRRPTRLMERCRATFGPTFTLTFVGGRRFVFLVRSEHVKEVFSGDPDLLLSGRANAAFAMFMGRHSLLALDGDPHRRHRRLLMPPFHGERMRAYGPLLVALTKRHLATWPRGRPFSLLTAMRALTLDAIFEAVFGVTDAATVARLTGLLAQLTTSGRAKHKALHKLERCDHVALPRGVGAIHHCAAVQLQLAQRLTLNRILRQGRIAASDQTESLGVLE